MIFGFPIVLFLQRAILQGTALLFGSTGEIITEKSGNLNLGIPGIMYVGGISGVIGGFLYQSSVVRVNPVLAILIPLLSSLLGSLLASLLYCFLTVTLRANQNVKGLALTTFGVGFGNFFGGSLIKLVESDVLPKTSQPSPDAFASVYEAAREAGEEVVVITVSSKLSGTYQSASIAAMDFPDQVFVVDTRSAAIGAGILAEMAVDMARQGCSAQQIVEKLSAERNYVRVVAMLDTLEYLKKGGRISKTVAFAGNLLAIKPVVNILDGSINMLGKARGSKQANNLLVEEIQKAGGVDFDKPVLLGYTGLSDALLQKYIADSAALWSGSKSELNVTPIGSVIGTHAGPGAVAVAFFAKN